MKKNIPLNILKTVEPIIKENLDLLNITQVDGTYYTITDKDESSRFFYKIFKSIPPNITSNLSSAIYIEKFPNDGDILGIEKTVVNDSNFKQNLEKWISIIKEYNLTPSVFDDSFIQTYTKEFFDEFELIDEDSNYAPFKSKQLFLIDEYLQILSINLEAAKNSENESFINSLQIEVKELNNEITSISKKQTLNKLATIWAKIQKNGMSLAKEFLTEAKKEVMKEIIKKGIELGPGKLSEIGGTIIDIIK